MNIAVYCSAKDTIADCYKQLGTELALWISLNGHTLVYGGATGGLMTVVSKTCIDNGGEVIGVVPERIIRSGRRSQWCTQLIEVSNMSERKQRMRETADCFVCLPGSYGTLDEMFDVIAAGTVGEHHKPIFIVNYHNFYAPLKQQIELMKQELFIPKDEIYKPCFVDTVEQLTGNLENLREQKMS